MKPQRLVLCVLGLCLITLVCIIVVTTLLDGGTGSQTPETEPVDSPSSEPYRGATLDDVVEPRGGQHRKDVGPTQVAAQKSVPDSGSRPMLIIRVLWKETQSPAAGINGAIARQGASRPYMTGLLFRTDTNGTFTTEDLKEGRWTVRLDRGVRESVVLTGDGLVELVIELPETTLVEGNVKTSDKIPVSGCTIYLSGAGRSAPAHAVATTGAGGRFRILGAKPKAYVSAHHPNHVPSLRYPIEAAAEGRVRLQLVLGEDTTGGLRGSVRNTDGDPVEGAVLRLHTVGDVEAYDDTLRLTSPPSLTAHTDPNGVFGFSGTHPGGNTLIVLAPGYVPLERDLQLPKGTWLDEEIVLTRGAKVTGRVLKENGSTPDGDVLIVVKRPGGKSLTTEPIGPYGGFEIDGLPREQLEIHASGGRQGRASILVDLESNSIDRVTLTLLLGSYIRGTVTDRTGKPLCGWRVQAYPLGSDKLWEREDKADSDGHFLVGNLEHDAYDLHVLQTHQAGGPAMVVVNGVKPGRNNVEIVVPDSLLGSAYVSGVLSCPWGEVPSDAVMLLGFGSPPLYGTVLIHPDSGGRFRVGPVVPGPYAIGFSGSWIERQVLGNYSLRSNEELDLGTVELRQGGYIEVNLLFEDQGAHRVVCTLEDPNGKHIHSLADAGTLARSEVLAPGIYTLSIWGKDIESMHDSVLIEAGVRKKLSVTLLRRR